MASETIASLITIAYSKTPDALSDYLELLARAKMLSTQSSETKGFQLGLFDHLVLNPYGNPLQAGNLVSILYDRSYHLHHTLREVVVRSPGYPIKLSSEAVIKNFANPSYRAAIIQPNGSVHLLDLKRQNRFGFLNPPLDRAA